MELGMGGYCGLGVLGIDCGVVVGLDSRCFHNAMGGIGPRSCYRGGGDKNVLYWWGWGGGEPDNGGQMGWGQGLPLGKGGGVCQSCVLARRSNLETKVVRRVG